MAISRHNGVYHVHVINHIESRLRDADKPDKVNWVTLKQVNKEFLYAIVMSTNIKERSIDKSSYFFRKIIEKFPNSKLTEKAKRRISALLNQQANM
jgi:hypothetical protein